MCVEQIAKQESCRSKGVGKGGGAKAPPEFLNRISYYLVLYMMNSFCNCKGMVSFVLVYM